MPPHGAAGTGQRGAGEDSDIIVALIRAAFIIAFYFMRFVSKARPLPLHMDLALGAATVFTLFLVILYVRGRPLVHERPFALTLDLLLVTSAISTVGPVGEGIFDVYYLVVIAGAIWFRRAGALLTAGAAIVLVTFVSPMLQGLPPLGGSIVFSSKAPLLLLVAVIAGYLVRARDAEHTTMVEMQQEMRLARNLQARMLPAQLPALQNYGLGLIFEPARAVGGDLYDLRLLDDDHLLIVLADMAGKSVYGLVHLSLIHSHLQEAIEQGLSPAEIAESVNHGAYAALQPESYAALFLGILRLSDGLLTFVNCGHVPPIRLRSTGSSEPDLLVTGGIVIGGRRQPDYEQRDVTLGPGDTLVCFSDGISDTRNRHGEQFGEERVAAVCQRLLGRSAQELAAGLMAEARTFAAQTGRDDVTVLVLCHEAAGE
jgi:hypothetical protein